VARHGLIVGGLRDQLLRDQVLGAIERELRLARVRFGGAQRGIGLAAPGLLLDIGEAHDHVADLDVVVHVERQFDDAAAGLRRQRRLVDRIDDTVPQALLRRRLRLDRQCREGHRRGLAWCGRFAAAGSKKNGNGQRPQVGSGACRSHLKAQPAGMPSLRNTMAAGQKPVKADCSRFRPTKAVSSSHHGETKWSAAR
jgi:hypothetical protein